MFSNKSLALLATVSATALVSSLASMANAVTLTFEGTVTEIIDRDPRTDVRSLIALGDTVSGSFEYDPDKATAQYVNEDGEVTYFIPAPTSRPAAQVSINGLTWSSTDGGVDDGFLDVKVNNNAEHRGRLRDSIGFRTERPSGSPLVRGSSDIGINFGDENFPNLTHGIPAEEPTVIDSDAVPVAGSIDTSQISKATGGITHFGIPNGFYIVDFDIDPASLSFGETVEPEPSPTIVPVVYLDFESGTDVSFVEKAFLGLPDVIGVLESIGHHESSNISLDDRTSIQSSVERIFSDSGIDVTVTQDRPDSGDYVTVEFAAAIGDENGVGVAYDMSPLLSPGFPDRFDIRKDARVAVFASIYDPSDPRYIPFGESGHLAIGEIAEIAAHEVAHTFGAMHIVRPPNESIVMDSQYTPPVPATFFDRPAKIDVPLILDPIIANTHNPEYHIRRYANGISEEDLTRLEPGWWDVGGFSIASFELAITDALSSVDSWYLATGALPPLDPSAPAAFGTDLLLFEVSNLIDQDTLTFDSVSYSGLSIFGQSKGSDFIDIYLSPLSGDFLSRGLSLEELATSELFFSQFDRVSGQSRFFSGADIRMTSDRTEGPNPVPIPLPAFLLLSSIACLSTHKLRTLRTASQ